MMNKSKYSRLSLLSRRLVDESFAMVFFFVGVSILAGACLMMILSSCSKKNDGRDADTRLMAVESLRLTVDNPKSLHIIAFSDMDSVFGRNFFSDDELTMIIRNISDFSSLTFGDSMDGFNADDPRLADKIQRGIAINDVIQSTINNDVDNNNFSGWKMKVLYEYKNRFNDTVKNEKYFIFDRDKQFIIHSFDIPIL